MAEVLGLPLVPLLAFALLVAGVVGSVVPAMPGALLSIGGVLLYWYSTGYAEPGTFVLAGLLLVGLLTVAVDWFAGAVSAKAAGASWETTLLAGAVGFLLLFVLGPLGTLLGVAGTVFAVELYEHGDAEQGARTALYTTVAMLGSVAVQALLTASMLVAMLWVAFM